MKIRTGSKKTTRRPEMLQANKEVKDLPKALPSRNVSPTKTVDDLYLEGKNQIGNPTRIGEDIRTRQRVARENKFKGNKRSLPQQKRKF